MQKPFVALQLYTVRDFTAQDVVETLRKVRKMGYEYVELAGTYGMEFSEFRSVLNEFGLKAISAHVQFSEIEADVKKAVHEYKFMGCAYIVIPMLPEACLPSGELYKHAKGIIEKFCHVCKEAGVIPAYHNHAFEFERLPGGLFKLDKFFDDIDICAQLDTGWIRAAGQNPETYIEKYAGRCPIIHIKDTIKTGEGFEDRPAGSGSQNIPGIIKTALAAGVAGFVAELDNAVGMTSLEAAEESRRFLKSLGF
ncbi:MAG: sugar phosphate isomerase/epimerase [Clostridiales bacterium]|jgi:sugar phosphate isomerase/epimerase|nr:sugar phosphate isomerase/epimerase [Clostridiales bacterium]